MRRSATAGPQYGSSEITVFAWDKNRILKFVGNTNLRSIKLTLQLVVVVLNAPTKFRDDVFKFTFYTIIMNKVGGARCYLGRHGPFPTKRFPRNSNSNRK